MARTIISCRGGGSPDRHDPNPLHSLRRAFLEPASGSIPAANFTPNGPLTRQWSPPKSYSPPIAPAAIGFFHDLGIPFFAESADIDESPAPNESPTEMVARLALAKTLTVAGRFTSEAVKTNSHPPVDILVVGADTVVAIDEDVLGKPANAGEARTMLARLRARRHQVHTAIAIALVASGALKRQRSLVNTTTVTDACLHRRRGSLPTSLPEIPWTRQALTPFSIPSSAPSKASPAAPPV